MLVHAICTETGANLFNLSAANITAATSGVASRYAAYGLQGTRHVLPVPPPPLISHFKCCKVRWLDGITTSMNMSLSTISEMVEVWKAWQAPVHGLQRAGRDLATE